MDLILGEMCGDDQFPSAFGDSAPETVNAAERGSECKQCGFVFATDEALGIHVRSAHSTAIRRYYVCPVCQRQFSQSCNLRTHLRVHTGERPFKCPECDRSFTNKVNMLTHARTHTGERPFVCTTCQKQFTQVSSLRVHVRSHTGERPYHCHLCDRTFAKSSDLRRHLNTHVRDCPFACDVCGKRFAHQSSLAAHARLHPQRSDDVKIEEEEDVSAAYPATSATGVSGRPVASNCSRKRTAPPRDSRTTSKGSCAGCSRKSAVVSVANVSGVAPTEATTVWRK